MNRICSPLTGRLVVVLFACGAFAMSSTPSLAQTDTTFTYQGRLLDGGTPASGIYNIDIALHIRPAGNFQIGPTMSFPNLAVSDGLFSVQLDYGANVFNQVARWLEISVNGTALSPRQPLTRAPYAIQTRGIFVDDTMKVGVGTTSPERALHVVGNGIRLSNGTRLLDIRTDGGAVDIESTTHKLFIHSSGPGGNNHVVLQPFGGEGNVGIGTEVPKQKLHVAGDYYGRGHMYLYAFQGDGLSGDAYLQARDDSGTSSIGLQLRTQDAGQFIDTMYLASDGNVGIGTSTPNGRLRVVGDGITVWATTSGSSGVRGESSSSNQGVGVVGLATAQSGPNIGVFGTAISGTGVSGSGNTGVLGISDIGAGIGVFGIANDTNGRNIGVQGNSNSSNGFDFLAIGAGTNYGAISSRRWKSNVVPIGNPLYKLSQLRGVYFDWDEDHGGHHDVGMIAEEVGAILPEIVNYEENGIDASGMDYSKMTPLLVEAINALRTEKDRQLAQIDADIAVLNKEVGSFRTLNDSLENRLAQLEALVAQLATPQGGEQ